MTLMRLESRHYMYYIAYMESWARQYTDEKLERLHIYLKLLFTITSNFFRNLLHESPGWLKFHIKYQNYINLSKVIWRGFTFYILGSNKRITAWLTWIYFILTTVVQLPSLVANKKYGTLRRYWATIVS